jgi:hypothetical protein
MMQLLTIASDHSPVGLGGSRFGVEFAAHSPGADVDRVDRRQVKDLEQKGVADESGEDRWYLTEESGLVST